MGCSTFVVGQVMREGVCRSSRTVSRVSRKTSAGQAHTLQQLQQQCAARWGSLTLVALLCGFVADLEAFVGVMAPGVR